MYSLPGTQLMLSAIFHLIEARALQVFVVIKAPVISVVQYKGFLTSFLLCFVLFLYLFYHSSLSYYSTLKISLI